MTNRSPLRARTSTTVTSKNDGGYLSDKMVYDAWRLTARPTNRASAQKPSLNSGVEKWHEVREQTWTPVAALGLLYHNHRNLLVGSIDEETEKRGQEHALARHQHHRVELMIMVEMTTVETWATVSWWVLDRDVMRTAVQQAINCVFLDATTFLSYIFLCETREPAFQRYKIWHNFTHLRWKTWTNLRWDPNSEHFRS